MGLCVSSSNNGTATSEAIATTILKTPDTDAKSDNKSNDDDHDDFDKSMTRQQRETQKFREMRSRFEFEYDLEDTNTPDCAISREWYVTWKKYASNVINTPPACIDNKSLDNGNGVTKLSLGRNIDYICIKEDLWKYFHDIC